MANVYACQSYSFSPLTGGLQYMYGFKKSMADLSHLRVGLLVPDGRDVGERLRGAHSLYDVGHGRRLQLAHLQRLLLLPVGEIVVGSRALQLLQE